MCAAVGCAHEGRRRTCSQVELGALGSRLLLLSSCTSVLASHKSYRISYFYFRKSGKTRPSRLCVRSGPRFCTVTLSSRAGHLRTLETWSRLATCENRNN